MFYIGYLLGVLTSLFFVCLGYFLFKQTIKTDAPSTTPQASKKFLGQTKQRRKPKDGSDQRAWEAEKKEVPDRGL